MANPQTENGHVDIANELVDAFARIRISGLEMQCLWVIIRKTYGWKKKTDWIALGQFQDMTGMNQGNICRALRGLLDKNIIAKIDNRRGVSYGLQKNYRKWKPLSKKARGSQKRLLRVAKIDNLGSPKLTTTKDTITKDTITKDTIGGKKKSPPNPDVKVFIDYVFKSFQDKTGSKMHIDGKKDGTLIKALLKTYPINELTELWDIFISSTDVFIRKAGFSIGVFKSQVNKLVSQKNVQQKGTDKTSGNWELLEQRKREGRYE